MKKLTKTLFLTVFGSLLIAACGGGVSGPGSLTLKYPGTDKQEVTLKSGGYYASTKSWSANGKSAKSVSYFVCVADHDIDMTQGAISIGAPVKSDGQTKVCFSIDGAENSDEKTAPKTETFPAAKRSDSFAFNSVSSASIRNFKDGKETKHFLNESKMTGEVKITSASENSMSGEINLSDGEKEIKGTFSAKAFERK